MSRGKCLGLTGVKGGVGTSLLTALIARDGSRSGHKRIAVAEIPSPSSLQPLFLGLKNPSRPLSGLLTYEGPLGYKALQTYFGASPEGVLYIPITSSEGNLSHKIALPLLEKLLSSLDFLVLDLPAYHDSAAKPYLAFCQRLMGITSSDPLCLAATLKAQSGLVAAAEGAAHIRWAVNQVQPRHSLPKDPSILPEGSFPTSLIPYGGDQLAALLQENRALPQNFENAITTLSHGWLEDDGHWKSVKPWENGVASSTPATSESPAPFDASALSRVQDLHQSLLQAFREQGLLQGREELGAIPRTDMEPRARTVLEDILHREEGIPPGDRERLINETLQLAFGLGPLEPFLKDETVTEIMVNGPHRVFVERAGRLEPTPVRFLDDQQLRTTLERILAPIGRRLDESQPYVDGRLSDGSRVNAVLPPISLDGPILTIRKFSRRQLSAGDLVRMGSLTPEASDFLGACVRSRKNIVVSGGTGSGKTTLLNVLSCFIPSRDRIVTIEDSAELRLSQAHVVRLEARPANLEGKGRISIRDLVINALRMRPDRIVVGEVRGGEALDMLQAMNTGHDGSLTTCHANTPRDALSRLETMCLMAGLELPLRAVREQVVRAIHLVVQQSRLPGGKRAVTHIAEVQGLEGETPVLQDLFRWNEEMGGLEKLPFRASFDKELIAAEKP